MKFYDWVLGPIEWPRVLVSFKKVDDEQGVSVQTIAGWFEVSPQLLGDLGFLPGYRRWPSFDEAIFMDLEKTLTNFDDELSREFPLSDGMSVRMEPK